LEVNDISNNLVNQEKDFQLSHKLKSNILLSRMNELLGITKSNYCMLKIFFEGAKKTVTQRCHAIMDYVSHLKKNE